MSNPGFPGCRTISQHLNDLKKENFSLKLRIYFLEEKIQQKFEESSDDVHRRNIELKVEVESLKNELEEKQQLLDKALSTAESLSNQNEAELQRHLADRQEEISHMQEILETKVQLLQEVQRQKHTITHIYKYPVTSSSSLELWKSCSMKMKTCLC
uniref:Centrosomin N-terminal motif 1 domain-containing protein n=1 Tax=Dicentrarchus labrax TaxID=13489 RepID=A0A8P4GEV6_DICLA